MALSSSAVRAIAVRRSAQRAASNDNGPRTDRRARPARPMTVALSDACVEASGFADHASY